MNDNTPDTTKRRINWTAIKAVAACVGTLGLLLSIWLTHFSGVSTPASPLENREIIDPEVIDDTEDKAVNSLDNSTHLPDHTTTTDSPPARPPVGSSEPKIVKDTTKAGPSDEDIHSPEYSTPEYLHNPVDPSSPRIPAVPCGSNSFYCRYIEFTLYNIEPGTYVAACELYNWDENEEYYVWRYIPILVTNIGETGASKFVKELPFCHINFQRTERVRITLLSNEEFHTITQIYAEPLSSDWQRVAETEWFNNGSK